MTQKEIGSEFEFCSIENSSNFFQFADVIDYRLVFSGRTAIETVLKNEPTIKKAMLPSYCCDSMIEPFRKLGIEITFYQVNYDKKLNVGLEIPKDVECLLLCNYFGFANHNLDVAEFVERGGIIIEDITHSFFSNNAFHRKSHYLVASLRKWEAIFCGGYCASRKGTMEIECLQKPTELFLEKKKKAMLLKKQYLAGKKTAGKLEFLQMYAEANKWLAENYSGLDIDDDSKNYLLRCDIEKHQDQRRKNAKILYEGLSDYPDIEFMFSLNEMDCPLFVPIIIQNNKRNRIQKKLIENGIYCPIHWPHPNAECESNLYDIELSLICDQRYTEEDMQRIVSVLCEIKEED